MCICCCAGMVIETDNKKRKEETMKQKRTGNSFKNEKQRYILYALFLIYPFIINQLLFYVNGYRLRFFKTLPVMNDEVSWWSQINALLTTGKPLGYYGYNGTHAPVGTIGAWGIAPLIPYVIFGMVFGWHMFSMTYANILFLSIAGFIFCLLARPDRKQLKWIYGLYACSFITIGFSMTAMSEGLRYAVGIILAGIILYVRDHAPALKEIKIRHIIIYLVILAFLFYAVNLYMIFALAALPIVWFMLKGLPAWARILISFVFTLAYALISYKTTAMYIAPYTVSTIGSLITIAKTQGIYMGLCALFAGMFRNLQSAGIYELVHCDISIVQWFMIIYDVILIWSVIIFIKSIHYKIKMRSEIVFEEVISGNCFLAIFLIAGFLLGYCALYTGQYWTLCRGINTGFLMALLLIAMGDWKEGAEPRNFTFTRLFVVFMTVLGIGTIWTYFAGNTEERNTSIETTASILEEKEVLSGVFDISPENTEWDNTIAHYGEIDNYYMALPDGAGINSLSDEVLNENARYVIYRTREWDEKKEVWEEMLKDSGHELIHEDDLFLVYIKK